MSWSLVVAALVAGAATRAVASEHGCDAGALPRLEVPHCGDGRARAHIDKRLGTLAADFPAATVGLCYTDTTLELAFEARGETSYRINATHANNDPLWMWTVMEAFIATGDHDPTEYLEFEVAPSNNIWTGMIHNPNKDFTNKATAFIDDWDTYPITSTTTKVASAQVWMSDVSLPLSLFNVASPAGTEWRMNFFRTYYAHDDAEQEYGAWNPNKLISFHQTPCFGRVRFAGAAAAAASAGAGGPVAVGPHGCRAETLPALEVPRCDVGRASAAIDRRLGTLAADVPAAAVGLCYTDAALELSFEAHGETSYLVDNALVNNDDLWRWTVMEAFIATGDHDPTEYFEFEVAPNNRIWTGLIHNPHKDFTNKATAFIDDWSTYPIVSVTENDVGTQMWKSDVSLPLSLFNVASPAGTAWRMNFFRTYYADENAEQEYGAWNPNKLISFHQTPCFGKVRFAGEATGSAKSEGQATDSAKPEGNATDGAKPEGEATESSQAEDVVYEGFSMENWVNPSNSVAAASVRGFLAWLSTLALSTNVCSLYI